MSYRPTSSMRSFEYSAPSATVRPLLSPRYGPSLPSGFPAEMELLPKVLKSPNRRRALSECGRSLFVNGYEVCNIWDDEEPKIAKKEVKATKGNPFGAFLESSDDESSDMLQLLDQNKKIVRKKSVAIERIHESVIGETEPEISDWETVSIIKKKTRTYTKQESPASPTRVSGYFSDEDDLYDLQQGTFSDRQYGSAKKTMQHKATAKRNYAIGKRNKQRGRE